MRHTSQTTTTLQALLNDIGNLPVYYASNDDVERCDVLCVGPTSEYVSRQSNLLMNLSDPQQLCHSKFL